MTTYSQSAIAQQFEGTQPCRIPCSYQSISPPSLRPIDLIAKLAGSNLKNTIRVIIAFEILRDYLGISSDELFSYISRKLSGDRPAEDNAEACEAIYWNLLTSFRDPRAQNRVKAIADFGNKGLRANLQKIGVSDES